VIGNTSFSWENGKGEEKKEENERNKERGKNQRGLKERIK
jgi:hypothetical protein